MHSHRHGTTLPPLSTVVRPNDSAVSVPTALLTTVTVPPATVTPAQAGVQAKGRTADSIGADDW